MAYCTNCGNYIEDDAKFCGRCGAKTTEKKAFTNESSTQAQDNTRKSKRETVYEGELHKCPSCGATLSAFIKSCPECGYELRGAGSTESVRDFSNSYSNASNNSRKIDLIRTFAIPNTKEDILEFVILASSNIDANSFSSDNVIVSGSVSQKDITEAWMAKLDQAHQKANIVLTDDPYLEKINQLYSEKKKELETARAKATGKKVVKGILESGMVRYLAIFALPLFIILMLFLLLSGAEFKLKKQVKQIEAYIAEENYDSALTEAYSMDDNYSKSWSETRKSLISRIEALQAAKLDEEAKSKGLVQIPDQKLEGKLLDDVISILTTAGFTNISEEPISNGGPLSLFDKKGTVKEITVNGDTNYSTETWIESDTPIVIRYKD